jgi:SAM-dependent methyltransferase
MIMDRAKSWENTYQTEGQVWGDQPSELARFALEFFSQHPPAGTPGILDLGCGYGRDAAYLCRHLTCRLTGIDSSPQAIALAQALPAAGLTGKMEFLCADFAAARGRYRVVFVSNFYQILPPVERARLRETIQRCLAPGGVLFLGTMAVGDPQHFGHGMPVAGEEDSFMEGKYLHFCTEAELRRDFAFLRVERLEERSYDEPRGEGTHHHRSWFLAGSPGRR